MHRKTMATENEGKKKINNGHMTVKKRLEGLWESLDTKEKAKLVNNGVEIDTDNLSILTRCNPSAFIKTVLALGGEKVDAICEIGFGSLMHMRCTELSRPICQQLVESIDTENNSVNIHGRILPITKTDFERVMGVKDGGEDIILSESTEDSGFVELWKSLYGEEKEITVENLKKIVIESEKADECFKISFALYAIGTVLCPSPSQNLDPKLIMPLKDHATIGQKNWSTFCFVKLMEGIRGFQKKKEGYIGGSVLFLQLFYCDLVAQRLNSIEKCMLPIVAWDNKKTKRLVKWIVKHGGLNCSLLFGYNEFRCKNKGSEDINVSPNTDYISMDKIEAMRSEVGNVIRETIAEFKKSVEAIKQDMVVSIVAEVLKSMQQPTSKEIVKGKLITEVGGKKVQVIESEGGNDMRSHDPSELDSLIVVGSCKPPQAPVSRMPEVRVNCQEVGNGSQQSDCSRSPIGPGSTTPKQIIEETNNRPHVRVLFPQCSNVEVNQFSDKPNPKISKWKVKSRKAVPLNVTKGISELDENILNFLFASGQLTAEESSHIVAACDGFLISRGDIACLQPQTPLLDDVINVMAAYMYESKNQSWFFPTHFGEIEKNNPTTMSRDQWMQDTRRLCCLDRFDGRLLGSSKIFIPLHDGEINHWFLVIVNTSAKQAVLYDSLIDNGASERRQNIVKTVLRHLDRVYLSEILSLGRWYEFMEFTVINADFNPRQENNSDCGVYVIRHMQNGGRAWGFAFNSADQRVRLALELVKHPKNQDQVSVFNNMPCRRSIRGNNARGRAGDGDVCSDDSGSFKFADNLNDTKKASGKRKGAAGKGEQNHCPNEGENENPRKARHMPRRR